MGYEGKQSWVFHVGNIRCDHATETEIVTLLLVWQVTGEEIATATKLLEKVCQKLQGIPEVPP